MAVRQKRIDAGVRVLGVDEYFFRLLEPVIHGLPLEGHVAAQRLERRIGRIGDGPGSILGPLVADDHRHVRGLAQRVVAAAMGRRDQELLANIGQRKEVYGQKMIGTQHKHLAAVGNRLAAEHHADAFRAVQDVHETRSIFFAGLQTRGSGGHRRHLSSSSGPSGGPEIRGTCAKPPTSTAVT